MLATALEGDKFGYKEFRREFKIFLSFKYLSKFICFNEADFMIKEEFYLPFANRKGSLVAFQYVE